MPRANKSRCAILGVLTLGPMTGYEIRKTIESSLANFWNESYGQIYPILKALVVEGLATSETVAQEGKPDRHVYTITAAGEEQFRQWLSRPVEHEVGRVEILLKLFFGWQASPAENRRKVEEFRELQCQLLQRYAGIEQWLLSVREDHPGLPYWLMTLDYGQRVARALAEWSDDTLDRLAALEQSLPAGAAEPDEESPSPASSDMERNR